ncbi:MAG TPA: nicotinate-nucleotide adenylyltransferase [Gemmataceae bacterium]|nr:nicotinate-nucleotide adenylyltransferase [Gemmataceae bacterium]
MRIGVFGGTFDPVHIAHLIIAEACREQAELEQVWFIPAARPPHKQDRTITPFMHRVEMLGLAIAGNPAFRIDELEKERPGSSYTVDTLAELQRQHPGVDWWLILGSDCLPDLPHWREPARIAQSAGFVVWERPGCPSWPPEKLQAEIGLPADHHLRFCAAHGPLVDISSSDLRQRAAAGRSLRYLVPRAVECYIETHHLYRDRRAQP